MKIRITLAILLVCELLNAEFVVHPFRIWGLMRTNREKVYLYVGLTNGFFPARGPDGFLPVRGRGLELAACLEEELTGEQAVTMIDKRYKDHPEKWSRPFSEQILEALTVDGSPCAGKNPLAPVTH